MKPSPTSGKNYLNMPNRQDMWKVVQGLKITSETHSPNEAMPYKGCTITDAKAKVNSFLNH